MRRDLRYKFFSFHGLYVTMEDIVWVNALISNVWRGLVMIEADEAES